MTAAAAALHLLSVVNIPIGEEASRGYVTYLVKKPYRDGLSEDQAFRAVDSVVDAQHLPVNQQSCRRVKFEIRGFHKRLTDGE